MDRTLEVSQINKIIKDIIDHECVLEDKHIIGEISSFSLTRGTAYFVIKDSESMLNCVMFNCKQEYQIGDHIIASGSIKYYPKGAKISLFVTNIEQVGVGDLYNQFLEMKDKLEKEGLFSSLHKLPIPNYIKRVGVVTSRTGAVIQDIINVRTRRNPNLDIVLYDVQVQGVLAKDQIIKGINFFSNYEDVDCVIVARGGGSLEDLQPFNEEEVARAVYNCKKPIISAVGHETDYTIIDFVADMRAPTPSAAAELVAFDLFELKNTLNFYKTRIEKAEKNLILDLQLQYNEFYNRLESCMTTKFNDINLFLKQIIVKLNHFIDNSVNQAEYRLKICLNSFDNLNPAKILSRGYSVIKKEGNYLKDYSNLKINDIITLENSTEICKCEVKSIGEKNGN